jgi:hypothetical protein
MRPRDQVRCGGDPAAYARNSAKTGTPTHRGIPPQPMPRGPISRYRATTMDAIAMAQVHSTGTDALLAHARRYRAHFPPGAPRKPGTGVVVVSCGLRDITDEQFTAAVEADVGLRPTWRVGTFRDVTAEARRGVARLRNTPFLCHTDGIRGFCFDETTGERSSRTHTRSQSGSARHPRRSAGPTTSPTPPRGPVCRPSPPSAPIRMRPAH